ncbi:MAG: leucyl aminopeptidase, partial [Bdellovibrionales bacterium]
ALGHEYTGSYVNTDEMWGQLEKASDATGDKLWRMPLDKTYTKEMESSVADLKNLGSRYAGSCTAAAFLEQFVDEGRSWAHLDIAGTAYINSAKPTSPKGGTGAGVRVLDSFVMENYG